MSRPIPSKFTPIGGTARLPTLGRTSETLANAEEAAVHEAMRSRGRTPWGAVMGRPAGLASAKSLFSLLSFWSVGSILSIGGAGSSSRTDSDEPGEEEER